LAGLLGLEQDVLKGLFKPHHIGLHFGRHLWIMGGEFDRRIGDQTPMPPMRRREKIDQPREELSDGSESAHRVFQLTYEAATIVSQ
jgi:hypothetical protein